eukprot:1623974-Pyramimonas_sp.AAC.1
MPVKCSSRSERCGQSRQITCCANLPPTTRSSTGATRALLHCASTCDENPSVRRLGEVVRSDARATSSGF